MAGSKFNRATIKMRGRELEMYDGNDGSSPAFIAFLRDEDAEIMRREEQRFLPITSYASRQPLYAEIGSIDDVRYLAVETDLRKEWEDIKEMADEVMEIPGFQFPVYLFGGKAYKDLLTQHGVLC